MNRESKYHFIFVICLLIGMTLFAFWGLSDTKIKAEKVNINTADKLKLCELPSFDKVIAQRIIDYRKTNRIDNLEEMETIKGIGSQRLKSIAPYIIFDYRQ